MKVDIDYWADYLLAAVSSRSAVQAISKTIDDLSVEDAYEIQLAALAKQLQGGDRVVGAKLGLTSAAKQQQMGVDQPVYGWLLESGQLDSDGPLDCSELIHPRCEPEIVFLIGEDLEGPGITAGDVLDATNVVCGGIEVIDSRYQKFSFTHTDVIADNTSAARFRLGDTQLAVNDVDLPGLGCTFELNGDRLASATGAALLGDPALCVAMLANHLARFGRKIEAGWTVLAGAMTDAVAIEPGSRVVANYDVLGSVAVAAAG